MPKRRRSLEAIAARNRAMVEMYAEFARPTVPLVRGDGSRVSYPTDRAAVLVQAPALLKREGAA